MQRASLDGRNRKPSAPPKNPLTPTNKDHLRPASPPKRNPWGKVASIPNKKNEDFPSLSPSEEQAQGAKGEVSGGAPGILPKIDEKEECPEEKTKTKSPSSARETRSSDNVRPVSPILDDQGLQAVREEHRENTVAKDNKIRTKIAELPTTVSSHIPLDEEGQGMVKGNLEESDDISRGADDLRRKTDEVSEGKEAQSETTHPPSPSSFSNTSEPTFGSKGSPDRSKDRTSDTVSICSSESRKSLEAAAPRATEKYDPLSHLCTRTKACVEFPLTKPSLWNYGVGSDVHVQAESMLYSVHRQLLVNQSRWFRLHLPPPNEDGTLVHVHLPFAAGAVGPCLSYMYTTRIDVVERDDTSLSAAHLPRCVLAYCAAVTLQMSGLCSHILRVVESTAADFSDYFATNYVSQNMDPVEGQALIFHLFNALKIIHSEPCYPLVRPMRLALAAVLDGILPCLIRQDTLFYMLALPSWKEHGPTISADMMEYRMLASYPQPQGGTVPSSEEQMDALFETVCNDGSSPGEPAMEKSCDTLRPEGQAEHHHG